MNGNNNAIPILTYIRIGDNWHWLALPKIIAEYISYGRVWIEQSLITPDRELSKSARIIKWFILAAIKENRNA